MSEIAAKWFDEAFGYHQNGNIAQAIPLYQKCLDANSESAGAWHLLGLALYQSGQPKNGAHD
jgi:tetratricopeptide (TPR) repeat protein